MPFEPLRFIHANGLCLDRPLDPAQILSDEIEEIVVKATISAFDELVALAVDQAVDFVLLTGNSFDAQNPSLPARVAWREGLEQLASDDIRVFAMPGASDPVDGWFATQKIPDNVTLFFYRDQEPVAVLRDGGVIATIAGGDFVASQSAGFGKQTSNRITPPTRGPLVIGMLPVTSGTGKNSQINPPKENDENPFSAQGAFDYLAIGGSEPRNTISLNSGIAYNPGSVQGLCRNNTGPRGCTLIEVDAERNIKTAFHSTAPARWEQFTIDVEASTDGDALAEKMSHALTQIRPETTERVWLVLWTVRGCGSVLEKLHAETFRAELIEKIQNEILPAQGVLLSHAFRLLPNVDLLKQQAAEGTLAAEYFDSIESGPACSQELLAEVIQGASITDSVWSERLTSLVGEFDTEVITGHALRLGASWFGTQTEAGERQT